MKEKLFIILFLIFSASMFALALRGNPGNPTSTELNAPEWKDEGPMELSPERGRYALLYSLIEDKSFHFSLPIARFTTPDLGYIDGKYVSLFAPGVSYILMPGYLIGRLFNSAQLGASAMIALFAVINGLLIYIIARKLGAKPVPAALGAMAFLFATPAFAYGVTLYQHHISTFLILISLTTLLSTRSFWATALIWFFFALSIPVDYPNLVLMAPIGIYALGRLISIDRSNDGLSIRFHAGGVVTFVTVLAPLIFFMWFNTMSYNNPFQLSGTVQRIKEIDASGNPARSKLDSDNTQIAASQNIREKTAIGFFKTRNMLNGLYVHFISPDRGIIYYSPIVLFAIFGGMYLYKRNRSVLAVMIAVVGICIVFYSLWGDPWGGYAFGSRYLIPAFSLLGILVALAIQGYGRQVAFIMLLFGFFIYSTSVNTLGAITSSKNPPQIEVLALEALSGKEEKYTYARNFDYINSGKSKSYVYNQYISPYLAPYEYYVFLVSTLVSVYGTLLFYWYLRSRSKHE